MLCRPRSLLVYRTLCFDRLKIPTWCLKCCLEFTIVNAIMLRGSIDGLCAAVSCEVVGVCGTVGAMAMVSVIGAMKFLI